MDDGFKVAFQQCQRMGEVVGSPITMPRITARQLHRSNQQSASVEEYFKKAIAIPFLDHLLTQRSGHQSSRNPPSSPHPCLVLYHRFSAARMLYSLNVIVQEYKDDLLSPELLSMQARRWKPRYSNMPENLTPASPAQVIEDCDLICFLTYSSSSK